MRRPTHRSVELPAFAGGASGAVAWTWGALSASAAAAGFRTGLIVPSSSSGLINDLCKLDISRVDYDKSSSQNGSRRSIMPQDLTAEAQWLCGALHPPSDTAFVVRNPTEY